MKYLVMKHGHKVGHKPLVYGTEVTARKLGVRAEALAPFVARGVLEPQLSRTPADKPGKTDE